MLLQFIDANILCCLTVQKALHEMQKNILRTRQRSFKSVIELIEPAIKKVCSDPCSCSELVILVSNYCRTNRIKKCVILCTNSETHQRRTSGSEKSKGQ